MLQQTRAGIPASEWAFIGFVVLFCVTFTFVELNNHRFWTSDFKVYFDATNDFFSGNNPYLGPYGLSSGYFKYTPFSLYLFYPLTLISYSAGQYFQVAILALSLVGTVLLMRRIAEQHLGYSLSSPYLLYLIFALVAIHITRELHLGNINLLLVLLCCLGLHGVLSEKYRMAALCWSIMILLKPIAIVVLLPMVLHWNWKLISYLAGFLLFFALFPCLHAGWNQTIMLWQHWMHTAIGHNNHYQSFNTIGAIVSMYSGLRNNWVAPAVLVGGLIAWMIADHRSGRRGNAFLVKWMIVFLAAIPNIFATDTEHFLYALPLLYVVTIRLRKAGSWLYYGIFLLATACYSFHSTDLLGAELIDKLATMGVLGIGNLLFTGLLLVMIARKRQEELPA